MGKAAMCMKMLEYLNTGRIYQTSELASLLETNSRNIIEYKKEIEEAGYFITSISGKYGGYRLDKTKVFPTLKLTLPEKDALRESFNYILSKKNFLNKDNYSSAMSKVLSNVDSNENFEGLIAVDKYQLTMSEDEIKERYDFLTKAIENKRVIAITYNSLKNGLKEHILHPYKLFLYNNSWFFLAWNPDVGDVWTFKVNRIEKYQMLNEKFRVWKYFNPNDYLDKYGMIHDGDYYHIELIAKRKRAMLMKERVYGKNQVLEKINPETYRVTLDMQNKEYIKTFILSCGLDVEVLNPPWLKEDIKRILKNMLDNYEKKESD